MLFIDREDAGKQLANEFNKYKVIEPIVLALPKGGIPVAYEVAKFLNAPLDIIGVRKIGAPSEPELAVGAIAEENNAVYDYSTILLLNISSKGLSDILKRERTKVHNMIRYLRNEKRVPLLTGKTAIIVDDGLATGLTAKAALKFVKSKAPSKIILATPVCSREAITMLKPLVDDLIYLAAPWDFKAVGSWYDTFKEVDPEEAYKFLHKKSKRSKSVNGSNNGFLS